MIRGLLAAAVAACIGATTANAAITVDGNYDADYGAAKSVVTYLSGAPTSNFGTPTPFTDAIGYSIYLTNSGGTIFGFLQTSGPGTSVGSFANLYFGINTSGSRIGFEITNQQAFTPGGPGPVAAPITFATTGTSIEFALPEAYFTSSVGGLASAGGAPGDEVVLRLSQAFGYSVAGGATYGPDRLGAVTLSATAVPGPVAGAGLIPLIGLAGAWYARRRKQLAA
jgi:hypothetical protein